MTRETSISTAAVDETEGADERAVTAMVVTGNEIGKAIIEAGIAEETGVKIHDEGVEKQQEAEYFLVRGVCFPQFSHLHVRSA